MSAASLQERPRTMPTVHQSPDSTTDPLSPPEVTPYFRAARYREAYGLAAAQRGLPPEPWAA